MVVAPRLQRLVTFASAVYLLFLTVDNVQTHYVAFEEVGRIAISVAYLHVVVPLNVTGVLDAVNTIETGLNLTFANFRQQHFSDPEWYRYYYVDRPYHDQIDITIQGLRALRPEFLKASSRRSKRLQHIRLIMPLVAQSISDYPDAYRYRRFLPIAGAVGPILLKGVFGTIHGLYNHRQLAKLKTDLTTVIANQNRMMTMLREVPPPDQSSPNGPLEFLRPFVSNVTQISGPAIIMKLININRDLDDEVDRIYEAVQAAQHHRLSVTLLSASALRDLFWRIKNRAAELDTEVLISDHSGLFQIETSYVSDGNDISLVIHVPTANKKSILRLMRYLPFPLSFAQDHFLMPQPSKTLLAISEGEPRLSMELDDSDLESCHKIGSMHMCERMGVLDTSQDLSCLGAMYAQKFSEAMSLCEMKVLPQKETALQLNDNWFALYIISKFTASVHCRNGTNNEHHLSTGFNKITLSSSCSLKLQQHQLFADSSLKIQNQIKEFKWSESDLAISDERMAAAAEVLDQAEHPNGPLDLNDINSQIVQNKRSPGWLYFFIVVGIICLLAFAAWIFFYIQCRQLLDVGAGFKLIYDFIWPPEDKRLYKGLPATLPRKHRRRRPPSEVEIPMQNLPSRQRTAHAEVHREPEVHSAPPPLPPQPHSPRIRPRSSSNADLLTARPTRRSLDNISDPAYYSDVPLPSRVRRQNREEMQLHEIRPLHRMEVPHLHPEHQHLLPGLNDEVRSLLQRAYRHRDSIFHPGSGQSRSSDSRRSRHQPVEIPSMFARHRRF